MMISGLEKYSFHFNGQFSNLIFRFPPFGISTEAFSQPFYVSSRLSCLFSHFMSSENAGDEINEDSQHVPCQLSDSTQKQLQLLSSLNYDEPGKALSWN